MTTTVTVTGTGTPILNPDRAGSGVHIARGATHLQFDAGRSTVNRLVAAGTTLEELTAVFLTHYHSDHLVGLQDVVLSHWINDIYDVYPSFELFAPNGHTMRFCERMLDVWEADLAVRSLHNERDPQPRVELRGFDAPTEPTAIFSNADATVLSAEVRHEPIENAVGYRVETPDGIIAISGDTQVCDEVAALAAGADVVVYEAMRMDEIRKRPKDKQYIVDYHADTRLIGEQMAELGIPTLMLTHLIPAPHTDAEKQAFADEVREGGYEGTVVVCDDLDAVVLDDGASSVRKHVT